MLVMDTCVDRLRNRRSWLGRRSGATDKRCTIPRWMCLFLWLGCAMLQGCAVLPANTGRTPSQALAPDPTSPLVRWATELRQAARTPHDTGFVLLDTPESAYASRLALVQHATRTLDLQYYVIEADASTEALLGALRAAAQRGVRVRILLDDFHSKGRAAQVLQLAFVPHIEMRLFNPLPGGRGLGAMRSLLTLRDFSRLQRRMHNKLFLADNVMGIVGGRNLGEAYFGQSSASNFADMDVLAAGTLVTQMSASFDRYWNHALAYPVQTLVSPAELDMLLKGTRSSSEREMVEAAQRADSAQTGQTVQDSSMPAPMQLAQAHWVWAPGALLVDWPAKFDSQQSGAAEPTVIGGLIDLMQEARNEVLIVSPYFVPGPLMMKAFADLRKRDVRVRVLTNSLAASDAPLAHIGYARWRKRLLELGVELYEMRSERRKSLRSALGSMGKSQHASLHAKGIVIDRTVLGVGSMNLDMRSHFSNSEIALLVHSPLLAQTVSQQMEEVMTDAAWRVTLSTQGFLQWRTHDGKEPAINRAEPDASIPLQLLLKIAAPFAPDALL